MIPTVGFNMRKVTKGNVTIKVRWLLIFCACVYLWMHAYMYYPVPLFILDLIEELSVPQVLPTVYNSQVMVGLLQRL